MFVSISKMLSPKKTIFILKPNKRSHEYRTEEEGSGETVYLAIMLVSMAFT